MTLETANRQGVAKPHRVVIVGGGFGGLAAAQALKGADVEITLIDRNNYHLFQPLLYQVATGGLSPGDIASPLRAILRRQKNAHVFLGEVTRVDPAHNCVTMDGRILPYETLIVATGVRHSYFGHDSWEEQAPGLKTIADAIEMRRRVFSAFEKAELSQDSEDRRTWLTFVVVGGGATGVELAGALAEIARHTLRQDFRNIDPTHARIVMVEGSDRILPAFPASLSRKARRSLERLGVEVRTGTLVTDISEGELTIKCGERTELLASRTILWAAGVKADNLARQLVDSEEDLDRLGRVKVRPDLSVPRRTNVFVIGDLASFSHQTGQPLPGVAPVAMSQGRYLAKSIRRRLSGKPVRQYRYFDKGNLATIGRDHAVADFGRFRFGGFFAWILWLFVHLMYLVEFDNRLIVLVQWAWSYITRNRGARLIT